MWVRVDQSKIPIMHRCRKITAAEGKFEPEQGEGLAFSHRDEVNPYEGVITEYWEVWVDDNFKDQLPRKAYLSGWFDAIEAVRKEMGKFNLTPPSNFKE